VTRFVEANFTEISDPTGPADWPIDSTANAYIMPYKSDLRFYIQTKVGQVKGFAGNLTTVAYKGSMTVTDPNGNRLTLQNVCYCPTSEYRILSFMKFRREFRLDFQFTGWETFMFRAANGFEVHGQYFNDIMHLSLASQLEINVVTTRTAAARNSLKRRIDEIIEEEIPLDPENKENKISGSSSDPEFDKEPASSPTSTPASPPPDSSPLGCTP
jgi:hypothetical protein